MSTQIISCFRFALQLLIGESVYTLGWKRRKGWFMPLAVVSYFLLCVLIWKGYSLIPGNHPAVYIAYYFSLFLISLGAMKLCYAVRWEEVLFAGVCGYATQHIAFAVITVIQQLADLSLSPIPDFLFVRLLPYLLISAVIYWGVIRRNAGKSLVQERDMRMVLLAFVILFTVIVLSVLVDNQLIRENSVLLQNVLCKLYAIVCSLLAIFVAYFVSRQNQILRENEIMEGMLRHAKENQKLSQETINIINIKCHDLKYRLAHIPRMTDADQKEYVEGVRDALAIYDNTFQTGNDALDLVLTEKSLLCSEYHIRLSCMVDGQALSFVKSADLYALFGNLLDNAIESVMKGEEEKRIISLNISRRGQGSHIHLENYCGEAVSFENGLPLTTKQDKDYHGFGVRSIRYIVEKYKGELLMRTDREHFLVDIIFFQK